MNETKKNCIISKHAHYFDEKTFTHVSLYAGCSRLLVYRDNRITDEYVEVEAKNLDRDTALAMYDMVCRVIELCGNKVIDKDVVTSDGVKMIATHESGNVTVLDEVKV